MADVALAAKGASSDPLTYVIPGAQEILIKAARASFDGSAASGSFVPALRILDPNGNELAACPISDTLTVGASADVSWFPRGGVSGGTGGTGIQFDTDNEGGWLDITTNNADGSGFGFNLVDTSGGGFKLDGGGGGWELLDDSTGLFAGLTGGAPWRVHLSGGGQYEVQTDGGVSISDDDDVTGTTLQENGDGGMTFQNNGAGDTNITTAAAASNLFLAAQGGGTGEVAMLGDYHTGVPASQVQVNKNGVIVAANVANSSGTNNITVNASTASVGGSNPGQFVRVAPNILLDRYVTEPSAPSDSAYVYCYDDSTHVYIKAVFANGHRAIIAQNF